MPVEQSYSDKKRNTLSEQELAAQTGIILVAGQDTTVAEELCPVAYSDVLCSGKYTGFRIAGTRQKSRISRSTPGRNPFLSWIHRFV